jgi:hypothetical protein
MEWGELLHLAARVQCKRWRNPMQTWTPYGLPGLARFVLAVVQVPGNLPVGNGKVWTEPRGGTVLIWRPSPGAEDRKHC